MPEADEAKRWRRRTRDLAVRAVSDLDSLTLTVTLLVGLVAALLWPPAGSNARWWTPYAIAVLLLLAVGNFVTRVKLDRRIETLAELGAVIRRQVAGAAPVLITENHVRADFMAGATDLSISGITLGRTTANNEDHIRRVLKAGGTVRIMLTAMGLQDEFARRFEDSAGDGRHGAAGSELKIRLANTHMTLDRIARDAARDGARGTLLVHELDFFTSCGVIIVNRGDEVADSLRGEIYHRLSTRTQTAFYLLQDDHLHDGIFEVFVKSFADFWEGAFAKHRLLDNGVYGGPIHDFAAISPQTAANDEVGA